MISYIVIIAVIITSLLLMKKYKMCGFVVMIALMGSDTDSAGLLYAISLYISPYKIIIRSLMLLIFIIVTLKLMYLGIYGIANRKFLFWYAIPLLISALIIFLLNVLRGNGLIVALSEVIWLGIPIFFIWTMSAVNKDTDRLFRILVVAQTIISMVILIGGAYTSLINGANYAYKIGGDSWYLDATQIVNAKISLFNFNKYSYNVLKFAQFQNPNALGFYSAVMISTSIYLLIANNQKRKIRVNLVSLFLLVSGIISWFNSLTRGPIFMVALAFGIYMISIPLKPKSYQRILFFTLFMICCILSINIFIKAFEYLFVDSSSISILSRIPGYTFAFDAIKSSPILGIQPKITDPVPHLLFLKLSAYYGLPVGILMTVPIIHISVINAKVFLRDIINGKAEDSLYQVMLNGILIGALLTNGIIVNVMFWVILAEIIRRVGIYPLNRESYIYRHTKTAIYTE